MAGNYKIKEVKEWDKSDVAEFLQAAVPNHECIDRFKYTTGGVLATLSKDDLRRQAKDEEAANVIWAELKLHIDAVKNRNDVLNANPATYTLFVRTPAEVAMELEVSPTDTVAMIKTRIGDMEGTPVESQRLVWNGIRMADHRTLASYNINHGACILLVPQFSASLRSAAPPAPRGVLMVPGNKAWQPSHSTKPYMPCVASDLYRSFPMSLEFSGVPDYKSFMIAAQKQCGSRNLVLSESNVDGAPIMEISPGDNNHEPVQTRIHLDSDSELLRLDTVGDIVIPNTRYKAVLHLHGEQKIVYLCTGADTERRT